MNAMVEATSITPITPGPVVPMVPQPMTPWDLVALVIQQGKELTVIDKVMEMQERFERRQAEKAFDAAVASAKAEIKPILKNREVDFTSRREGVGRTNYDYEDFGAIAEHVDPILAKYGLSYRHRPKQEGKMLTITCILAHRDGHREETPLTAPNDESGNKNGIQGIGSTATFLQRYTLKLALGLATTRDDDGRGASAPETISDEQIKTLEQEIKTSGADNDRFLEYMGVSALADIPAQKFQQAMQALKDAAKAKARAKRAEGGAQ